jgi:hypothetical protein
MGDFEVMRCEGIRGKNRYGSTRRSRVYDIVSG